MSNSKIDTEIIKKEYGINQIVIPPSAISTVYTKKDNIDMLEFKHTVLINNKSNTFLKNTTINYNSIKSNETNIDVININHSKLNGSNVKITNTYNTFSVNINNSQSTIKSLQLALSTISNARNQNQSFFNFPAPTDTKNFIVQPMMISNGLRTIWSEGKYGWINRDQFTTFEDFRHYVPHDLNGQSFTLQMNDSGLVDLHNYHNGSITLIGTTAEKLVTIKDCSIKLTLSGFIFKKLNILNCNTVYLDDCTFGTLSDELDRMREIKGDSITPWNIKQSKFSSDIHYSLSASNSKIYIKNDSAHKLIFSLFFIGIHANNNSLIYMIPKDTTASILLRLNLSNYDESTGMRPIFMLASNGSVINCNYCIDEDNKIFAEITYPLEMDLGYSGTNGVPFEVTSNLLFDANGENYRRVKSLLISLWSEVNNSKVNFSLNTVRLLEQPENISVPLFGLYQMAKPKMNVTGSRWKLTNNYFHILSGDGTNHISGENNNLYFLNTYINGEVIINDQSFLNYNCPAVKNITTNTNISPAVLGTFPYLASQPHLAHYFSNEVVTVETKNTTREVEANLHVRTLYKQPLKNISNVMLDGKSFSAFLSGLMKLIFYNANTESFYYYNNGIVDITELIKKDLTYILPSTQYLKKDQDITKSINNFFTTSFETDVNNIHNVYYDKETNLFFYLQNGETVRDLGDEIYNNLHNYSLTATVLTSQSFVYWSDISKKGYIVSPTGLTLLSENTLKLQSVSNLVTHLNASSRISGNNFINSINIAPVIAYTNTLSSAIRYKKKKKTKTQILEVNYDPVSSKFYYLDNNEKNYDLDSNIKNSLIYKYQQTIDVTDLYNNLISNRLVTINGISNVIRYDSTNNKFKLNNSDIAWSKIKVVYNALHPDKSKYYYLVDDVNITLIIKNSKHSIKQYSPIENKNVDVYYHNGIFYYWKGTSQLQINISYFTTELDGNMNYYFSGGILDITDTIEGANNNFVHYMDGQNRRVFYDFLQKEFYYYNNLTDKIDVTDKIAVETQYFYNNTLQTNITNCMTNDSIPFYWTLSSCYVHYIKNENKFRISGGANDGIDVTSAILPTVISTYNEDESAGPVYFYLTSAINITNILVNYFIASIDGLQQNVYYDSESNSYFIKDSEGKQVDVTLKIINNITWTIGSTDISNLYKYPNYDHVDLTDYGTIYYDDQDNILYTPSFTDITTEVKVTTNEEDEEQVWKIGLAETLYDESVIDHYFDAINYLDGGTEQLFKCYWDKSIGFYKLEGGTKKAVNDQITGNLDWYYDNENINTVISGSDNVNVDIKGTSVIVTFSDWRFNNGSEDVTYFITGNLLCYYRNEDITDIILGDKSFTIDLSGKPRTVYYSPFSGIYYLDKLDKTSQLSSQVKSNYNGINITDKIYTTADSFSGTFVNDDGDYIPATISYDYLMNGWYYLNSEGELEYITDNIEASIVSSLAFQRKLNINNVVSNPEDHFKGELINNGRVENIFYDETDSNLTSSKFYYKDENNKTYYDTISSQVEYYCSGISIKNAIVDAGNTSFNIDIEDGTNNVNVFYDNEANSFYYSSEKIDITEIIIPLLSVCIHVDLPIVIDMKPVMFSGGTVNIDGYLVKYSVEQGYYHEAGRIVTPYNEQITGKIKWILPGDEDEPVDITTIINNPETDYVNNLNTENYFKFDVNEEIGGELSCYFVISTLPDSTKKLGFISRTLEVVGGIETTVTTDITDLILANLIGTYKAVQDKLDITDIFTDTSKCKSIGSIKDVYWDNYTLNYYNYNNRHGLQITNADEFDYVNITHDSANDNWFYNEDFDLTDIMNSSPFTTDVLREIYYYDLNTAHWAYNNLQGLRVNINDQINDQLFKKYFYDKKDITNVINGDGYFTAKYDGANRVLYFNKDNWKYGDDPKDYNSTISTNFADSFYYIDNNMERVYTTKKQTFKSTVVSTYYWGNLLDITDNMNRQYFKTYISPATAYSSTTKDPFPNIYYDLYGGKKKNLGVFHHYRNALTGTNINSKISGSVTKNYYFNNKNVTDVIKGAHFYHNTTSKRYTVYRDDLTGRMYYLSGDVKKVLSGADKGNKLLSLKYNGKVNLTAMKAKSLTAFYTYTDLDSNIGTKTTFKIAKDGTLSLKANSKDITSIVSNRTKKINGNWYLDTVDIKRIMYNGKKWFMTPIDGVTRRVYFQFYKAKKNNCRFYYTVNKKKIDVTLKINSKLTYFNNNQNIDKVFKGTAIQTRFENAIEDGKKFEVFYDKTKQVYYYYNKLQLDEEYVKNNIWVDVTSVYTYPSKWAFLAWVDEGAHEVFCDKKRLYFYKNGKTKIKVASTLIVNGVNYFNANGDGKFYYHDTNLSEYLIDDYYLKVMVDGRIIDVYRDVYSGEYYYIKEKKIVNDLIEPYIRTRYFYNEQNITNVVYPSGYREDYIDPAGYKNKFRTWWEGGTEGKTKAGKWWDRPIYYYPEAGFYAGSDDGGGQKKTDSAMSNKAERILNDQIYPYLTFYYYDRETDLEDDITYVIEDKDLFFTAQIDGVLRQIYFKYSNLADGLYSIKYPSNLTPINENVPNVTKKLHKGIYYYIDDGGNEVNVNSVIIPNLVIRYRAKDITLVIEDGKNYFLTVDKGLKKYVYFNSANQTWYFYKDNKFSRNTAIDAKIKTNSLVKEGRTYFCYTTNIDLVINDKKDKYRFLGTTEEDVFYDFGTKNYYYYLDEDQTQREIITQEIEPNLYHQYNYTIAGTEQEVDVTDLILGKAKSISIVIDGTERIINYDYLKGKFWYLEVEDIWGNGGAYLSPIHNTVEMVCSTTRDKKNVDLLVNITNSLLYLDIYKLNGV